MSQLSAGRAVRSTMLLVAPALLTYLLPGVSGAMIYDRSAILAGELWRLLTGHWVHFSASHLFCDTLVLGASAWLIESRRYGYLTALCLSSGISIGLAMLVLLPDMAFCGGLSGIAMAGAVYLGLQWRRETAPWRGMCLGILLLSLGKLVLDASSSHFTMVRIADDTIVPVPLSHLAGAASGMAVHLWSATKRSTAAEPAQPPLNSIGPR